MTILSRLLSTEIRTSSLIGFAGHDLQVRVSCCRKPIKPRDELSRCARE